ncbi:hypothetical protein Syun_011740 [Stephania yunnanensis]|uniref:Uncharacterized protein n=1 Tax=Stephania yunnanensis TaxID=152371 RepID=A0AAP0JZ50_9MAGN
MTSSRRCPKRHLSSPEARHHLSPDPYCRPIGASRELVKHAVSKRTTAVTNVVFLSTIVGLVLSPLPVCAVKVIVFLSTIVVIPPTCAFSISISTSIKDFDAETLAGECDLCNVATIVAASTHHHLQE